MASMASRLVLLATRAAQLSLALQTGVYLLAFVVRAHGMLSFAFPLDYGEGPLLAQVEALRSGTPIWALYADPAAAPHLIVNYPPLYLLFSAGLAALFGSTLMAGRLIALGATLASVGAIAVLSRPTPARSSRLPQPATLLALLLLSVPIVREWASLMRVDLLGLALGLWGLVLLVGPRGPTLRRGGAAGLVLTASLFVKPSLLAAPLAAWLWLAWWAWRAPAGTRLAALRPLVALSLTLGLVGGLLLLTLQLASGGWLLLHVVAANANRWEAGLAWDFWAQQIRLRWAFAAAAGLVVALALRSFRSHDNPQATNDSLHPARLVLALLYTIGGVITAIGVGKVGAYSNYFLELYAGLAWIVAMGPPFLATAGPQHQGRYARLAPPGFYILLVAALLYYPPLWDTTRLRPAGLIEPSPPRMILGRYGLPADMTREAEVLAALNRVNQALTSEVQAAGPQIFTDMPGVAATAGVGSRLQVFEARQLLDQGLIDEQALLQELASGSLPLAVIDYLGNWLTPGVTTILQRRYAQDGSLGTFDLYRPVESGPLRLPDQSFNPLPGLHLAGYRLAVPAGQFYEPGETLALSLVWQRDGAVTGAPISITLGLASSAGPPLIELERPLLYGVYPPPDWPVAAPVEHMQPLTLPPELPGGSYRLLLSLQTAGQAAQVALPLTTLEVAEAGGAFFAQTGRFVPGRLMRAWAEMGAIERVGLPLTPAVPFAWGRLQCFERTCLELRGSEVTARPLGTQLYMAETTRGASCLTGTPDAAGLCPDFASAPASYSELGPVLSGELERNGWIVQWTEGARLERPPGEDLAGLGRLGDESLRLAPGASYRWP